MNILKDFNDLKKYQKELVIFLSCTSAFTYVDTYFISKDFITEEPFLVTMLFAVTFSIVQSILGAIPAYYLNSKYFCWSESSTFLLLLFLINISVTSLTALYQIYCDKSLGLFIFFMTTLLFFAVLNVPFIVFQIWSYLKRFSAKRKSDNQEFFNSKMIVNKNIKKTNPIIP